MDFLGDDGKGYELARKLETHGVWRQWLGDSMYTGFVNNLSSQSNWTNFMKADSSKTRAQIELQLRARALLFDKASISLYLNPNHSSASSSSSSASVISKLNPNYLKLHGDDIYFTLENSSPQCEGVLATNTASLKAHSKASLGIGARYGESETDNMSQKFPESWYSQFFEKYRASKPYRLSFGDRDTDKRTPEQMSAYLNVAEKHKKRRVVFKDDQNTAFGNSVFEVSNLRSNSVIDDLGTTDDENLFFPETMFTVNCVPDSVLPPSSGVEDNKKVDLNGILDTLPQIKTKGPIMIERFGIRPEYLSTDKKNLGKEEALEMSKKVIAQTLKNVGFEAASEESVEVLSQLLSGHICKLGRILKVLSDNYRKQYSAMELIKMFLQTTGNSNFGALAQVVKDDSRNYTQQTQQLQNLQSQMQLQQQAFIRQPQQMARELHPQLQHMVQSQNLTLQQQQQLMRRRQPPTSQRPIMNVNMGFNNSNMDKERPMLQVKTENTADFPVDNAFNTMNSRQMQFRQQQMTAMSALQAQAQAGNQFRSLASLQVPPQMQMQMQTQTQSLGMVRAPPVKVEGFSELMGGDASLKHDENKLTSPSK
ncbi:BTP domain-containing protein [Heracleum sosnowskyi]|uniref:BTP domain-containing protein n=1 Tax=Heracleum sosnowskyi TaxID=360622 RepID=A0AAD8MEV1_9APIA|nr:BTP domain-containing protein [Heracleum sosnowskyi]